MLIWSYILGALGVGCTLIASHRPRIGWAVALVTQVPWMVYEIQTEQWGFLLSTIFYVVAYWRLHQQAHRAAPTPEEA